MDSLETIKSPSSSGRRKLYETWIGGLKQSVEPQANEIKALKEPLGTPTHVLAYGRLVGGGVGFAVLQFARHQKAGGWGAMQYPQLVLGIAGHFCIRGRGSGRGKQPGRTAQTKGIRRLQNLAGGPFHLHVLGQFDDRPWTDALQAFNFKTKTRKILTLVVPLLAFGVILGVNALAQKDDYTVGVVRGLRGHTDRRLPLQQR